MSVVRLRRPFPGGTVAFHRHQVPTYCVQVEYATGYTLPAV